MNLKKLFNKKLTLIKKEEEGAKMDIDENPEKMKINQDAEALQSILEWRNHANKKLRKDHKINENEQIIEVLMNIEEKITDYLKQNDKEWEFIDMRQNWVYY
jgi:hypothetical protein